MRRQTSLQRGGALLSLSLRSRRGALGPPRAPLRTKVLGRGEGWGCRENVAVFDEPLLAGGRFPSWARYTVCFITGLLAGFLLALPQLRFELSNETFRRTSLRNGVVAPLDDTKVSYSRYESNAERACSAASDMLVRAVLGPWVNVTESRRPPHHARRGWD
jgi:hypothetical protein